MKDVLKIQWVDVRGESRQGRQLQKSCPCSWKGESPKRFPESSRCHWDQSKPFWFQTLVVLMTSSTQACCSSQKKSNQNSLKGCRLQSEHTGRNLACLYLLPTLCLLICHLQVPLEHSLLSTAQEPPASLNNLLDKISCSNIGSWRGKHNKSWLKEHCVTTSSTLCACAWGYSCSPQVQQFPAHVLSLQKK